MTKSSEVPFGKALSLGVRRARLELGWSQEQLARRMLDAGLPWTRDTVASVERRRSLTLEEAVAVAFVLRKSIPELLVHDGCVRVGRSRVTASALAALLGGGVDQLSPGEFTQGTLGAEAHSGIAERKVAARLNTDPRDLNAVAFRLWGCSLTDERERRLAASSAPPRSQQAQRGHITRELLTELLPRIRLRHQRGRL
jgi:transcriptional regulator with XRE-family HTH domain